MSVTRRVDLVSPDLTRFWQVTQDGTEVIIRYGRTGSVGRTTRRASATEEAARADVDRRVADRLRAGYVESAPTAEPWAGGPAPMAASSVNPVPESPTGQTATPAASMVDEETFVVPASWHSVLLPRRGAAGTATPPPDPEAQAEASKLLDKEMWHVRRILRHDDTDPDVAAAGHDQLAGRPSPLGAGAVAAALRTVVNGADHGKPQGLADRWLTGHGLTFAVAATVELFSLGRDHRRPYAHDDPLRRLGPTEAWFWLLDEFTLAIAGRVRAAVAAAPPEEYAAAVATLRAYQEGTLHQQVAAAFLAPTETDWHERVVAAVLAAGNMFLAGMLLAVVTSPAHVAALAGLASGSAVLQPAALLYSFVAGAGPAAAPTLAAWMEAADVEPDVRRWLPTALATLPTDEAFQLLLDRMDRRYVPPAVWQAAARFPARALRLLALRRGTDDLLRTHVLAHRDVAERVLPALPAAAAHRVRTILAEAARPEAPVARLPALLVSPPWTARRAARRPVVVAGLTCPDAPSMSWRPGEREAWRDTSAHPRHWLQESYSWDWLAERFRAGRLGWWDAVDFFVHAPEEIARSLVGRWRPEPGEDVSWARIAVARFELDALPAVLEAARSDPAAMAGTLVPYAAPEVALLMADWLNRTSTRATPLAWLNHTSTRAAALAWLTRHAAAAARALVPPALGTSRAERRSAELALTTLAERGYGDDVRTAAQTYGPAAAAAIEALLDRDPVEVLPARIPTLPDWANPAMLPRVRLRDSAEVLPLPAAGHVLTMLAMSRLRTPYAGLAVVRQLCDPGSLADFAWSLFRIWQTLECPPAGGWVLDALGLVGDDETVRRLALVIQDWAGENSPARAIAGLDVLAAIGTDMALTHLHAIAGRVRSKTVRERAAAKVAEIAAGLGLAPAQLADRLVPDLGLDATGGLVLDYGPRRFVVDFDERLTPYVRDAAGKRRSTLPKPGVGDDPGLVTVAHQRFAALRRGVRAVAADQIHRLEQAMVAQRRWTGAEFRGHLVGHPLLRHLVRRLVWGRYDARGELRGAVRMVEDGAFADVHGVPVALPDDAVIGVAHPIQLGETVAAWVEVFADHRIRQPFPQLNRPVYELSDTELAAASLDRFDGVTVHVDRLLGLEDRGWQRCEPEDAGRQGQIERDLPDGGAVVIDLDPGIVVDEVTLLPEQTITGVWVRQRPVDKWDWGSRRGSFGDLDPVTRSEVVRELTEVTA